MKTSDMEATPNTLSPGAQLRDTIYRLFEEHVEFTHTLGAHQQHPQTYGIMGAINYEFLALEDPNATQLWELSRARSTLHVPEFFFAKNYKAYYAVVDEAPRAQAPRAYWQKRNFPWLDVSYRTDTDDPNVTVESFDFRPELAHYRPDDVFGNSLKAALSEKDMLVAPPESPLEQEKVQRIIAALHACLPQPHSIIGEFLKSYRPE